jgi:hypothetical protein
MFVRDTLLDKETEEKYIIGRIIKEPTFCDVSQRVGGLLTSHRFAILSNHFVDFNFTEQGTNWGLFVCKRNSYFKIIDIFKIDEKTQISLLHLDDNWTLFENNSSNVEEDIIKISRERFKNKVNSPPIPELATKRWLERLINPIGIDQKNNYFPLIGDFINKENPEVVNTIYQLDSIIDKILEKMKNMR